MNSVSEQAGFTLIELLLVIVLLSIFFAMVPDVGRGTLTKIENQNEVQHLVDLLRLAQRRAITSGVRQYLTLDPVHERYRFYELDGVEEKNITEVSLRGVDLLEINRSVNELPQTFYYTPAGTSVFGCTISLKDTQYLWKVIISVGSGRVRIARE